MGIDPDNLPDKTLHKLQEEDHKELDNLIDDAEEEIEDRRKYATLMAGHVILAEMFKDNLITLREYMRFANYLEERGRELDHTPR